MSESTQTLNRELNSTKKWRWLTLGCAGAMSVGIAAAYLYDAGFDRYDLFESLFDFFAWVGLTGTLMCVVFLFGWARKLGRRGRVSMALTVFACPWLAIFAGYLAGVRTNVHSSGIVVVLLIPLSIPIAIALLIMAARAGSGT